jgi:carboxypeptidase Taq
MSDQLNELKTRLLEIDDLDHASALLSWDQSTYMPPGGGPARGRQRATLARLAHEKFADPSIGRLLDDLRPYEESLPYDADDASLIRVTRRLYEKEIKVPGGFVSQTSEHGAASYDAWVQARPANDFSLVQPFVEKTVEYSRQYAGFFPGYEHIADPLVDNSQDGMTSATIRALFAELRAGLVPLVKMIASRPPLDDSPLRRHFPEARQLAFATEVVKRFGYDFMRGRIDKTRHPFMVKFSLGDVRITTRFNEDYLGASLFSSMHEAGHAMYEQGINLAYEGTPLARGASSGAHESQSRLWENLVGRSRGFWQYMFPALQTAFPGTLDGVTPEAFYRASNKVEPGLIRTAADEVTYSLHVMIRFELEQDLLEGRVSVRDLPRIWRERYHADLGVESPDDRDGVLQDVHWYKYLIGGSFHAYTLGNIMAAQFYEAALAAHPEIPADIARGEFGTLRGWLTDNVYQYGRKFTPPELMQRVTGKPLTIEPYLRYLRAKYTELYA